MPPAPHWSGSSWSCCRPPAPRDCSAPPPSGWRRGCPGRWRRRRRWRSSPPGWPITVHAIELPFAWYQGYWLERRYGLSTQILPHWLADHVKAAVASCGGDGGRAVGRLPVDAVGARAVVGGLGGAVRRGDGRTGPPGPGGAAADLLPRPSAGSSRAVRAPAAAGRAGRRAGDRRLRVGARAATPARPTRRWPASAGRGASSSPTRCSTPTPRTRSRSSSRTSCRTTCTTTCGAAWRCRRRPSSPVSTSPPAVLDPRGALARAARDRRRRRGAGAAAGRRRLLVRDAAARQRHVAGPGAARRPLRAAA